MQRFNFRHHIRIDMQASGSINQDDIGKPMLGMSNCILCNIDRVCPMRLGKKSTPTSEASVLAV